MPKAFRVFTQHQTPLQVIPNDIREALGAPAQKKNVYYGDFPKELMNEMWSRFKLALEPLRLAEQARRVHVVFNNNLRDQGIRGARLFTTLVQRNTSTST